MQHFRLLTRIAVSDARDAVLRRLLLLTTVSLHSAQESTASRRRGMSMWSRHQRWRISRDVWGGGMCVCMCVYDCVDVCTHAYVYMCACAWVLYI